MILEILFCSIYLFTGAVTVWSLLQLKSFLDSTPSISDEIALERFKALVRIQMYLALVVIGVMVTGMILGIVLISEHGMTGLAVVLFTNLLFLPLGIYHKRVETRTRNLKADSTILAQEYREICETWVKKALPDF